MIATFNPSTLKGKIDAPPSKSMAHRLIIGSALSREECVFSGVSYSEDILASLECLSALGVEIKKEKDKVFLNPSSFMKADAPILNCNESGSTLRFFMPLCLCLGKTVTLTGSERLFERPLFVYEKICEENGFTFIKNQTSLTLKGNLKSGDYKISGNISSQFITGLIFALLYLGESSSIEIIPPFESKSYIDLTIFALSLFGAKVYFSSQYKIQIEPSNMHSFSGKIEGDYSNGAFLDAFNYLGSEIDIKNLHPHSLQGDKIYKSYFEKLEKGAPVLDISDCPDLGPILISLAAMKNGATFLGTDRLKIKESDRSAAMDKELRKLGGGLIFGENQITVPKSELRFLGETLDGHNDHRIVMALSVILSKIGGKINGAEAVMKSYPDFFEDIKKLGAKVDLL